MLISHRDTIKDKGIKPESWPPLDFSGNLALLTWLVFSFLNFGCCFFIDGELNIHGFSPYPGDRTTATTALTVSGRVHELVHATASTFTHTSASPSRTMYVADSISSTAPSLSISGASTLGWHPVAITLTKRPTPHWNYNISATTAARSSAKYSSSTTPTLTVSKAESSTHEASDTATSAFWKEQSTPTALSNNTMISSSADGSRSRLIFSAAMLFGANLLISSAL
ncbi:uncharacterized protein AFUA_7G08390 [Aspergillus fumigatus Af293]|uniref:Uncharacterized protein n=1 Tax=Aspergillus fumigatus (strain ATCC MYA-4609 / CBS 101355 / FGSC A1100 / Af293) TaxID=330879 RepID=Q4WH53_ASPFU|nr:hypothetical protein AFUA_7G08390 [Aspergillus fumigatus Af293]EAL86738.1 hypothetical protein AFUA_7G08390 [Aspergillus fumigatus Af293]